MSTSGVVGWRREFGEGPLSRTAALVYHLLVVELLLLLAAGPGLVAFVLLDHDASNLPLAALCALPLGPAFSAALYTVHSRRLDLTDLRPAAAFWRGYRANVWGVLRIWAAWLVWLTIIAVNLAHFSAAGVPAWWVGPLLGVGLAATLWLANALVIASLFVFRTVDVARLAAYYLVRAPGAALADAGLLLVAAAVTVVGSEVVLALLGSLFALALLRNSRRMIADIRTEFTA
jgi:hypothetical protein